MPRRNPPLTPREVRNVLEAQGFEHDRTEGSHEQWVGNYGGSKRVVTVDAAEKEFSNRLMKSMIRQSGMSRDEFYRSTERTAKKINKTCALKPNKSSTERQGKPLEGKT